jgi:chromosome segregation ATPase
MSEYCKNCEALLQENEELKEKMQIINDARITLLNIQDGMCSDLVDFKAKNKLLKEQLLAEREKVKELEEQLELNTANAVVVDYATRLHEYKQALDEIEKILRDAHRFNTYCEDDRTQTDVRAFNNERILTVLDIISKAKGEE